MPPKSKLKSKTAQPANPVVKTRSGRQVIVPERAAFEGMLFSILTFNPPADSLLRLELQLELKVA